MAEIDKPKPVTPGKKARVALIASLALNLLFIGALVGSGLGRMHRPEPDGARDLGFGLFSNALSPDDIRALRRAAIGEAGALRALRAQAKTDNAQLLTALRTDPFDPEALQVAMVGLGAGVKARQSLGERLMLARIIEMASDERNSFADRLEEAMKPRHRGR